MLVATAALALFAAFPVAARGERAAPGDPLTGVWKGRCTGNNPVIPPEGVPFTLVLESRGEDEAVATLAIDGLANSKPAEAEFDAESGELSFRCELAGMGILVDVEGIVAKEEFSGKATGLGVSAEMSAKRTSLELPKADAPAGPGRPVVDLATLSPDAWREDLRFLAENLPKVHVDAFHAIKREDWERRVREIDERLPRATPAQSAVALAQLVAAVGDSHTELGLGAPPFDRFLPVAFTWFSDGLFVTAIDERYGEALAARVLRIGVRSADEAIAAVCTTFTDENGQWRRAMAPSMLARPALLEALGVVTSANALPLVVAGADGADVAVTVEGSATKWLFAPDRSIVPTPLWQRDPRSAYWFEVLEPQRAVYLAYNRCAEDPGRPIAPLFEEVFAALDHFESGRLVIDLRHNSGGNSGVLSTFLTQLAEHTRAPRELDVLIGPSTYSSGMTNAAELRRDAGARLLGEPTGGKPNSYGEMRAFALPRSGLYVFYSTKLFGWLEGDPQAVEPDVLVPLRSADAFAGADPVLERALRSD